MAEFPYCDMICSGNTVGSETIMIGMWLTHKWLTYGLVNNDRGVIYL